MRTSQNAATNLSTSAGDEVVQSSLSMTPRQSKEASKKRQQFGRKSTTEDDNWNASSDYSEKNAMRLMGTGEPESRGFDLQPAIGPALTGKCSGKDLNSCIT